MNDFYVEILKDWLGDEMLSQEDFSEKVNYMYDEPVSYGIETHEPIWQAICQAVEDIDYAYELYMESHGYNDDPDAVEEDEQPVLNKEQLADRMYELTQYEQPKEIIQNLLDFFDSNTLNEFLDHMCEERSGGR